MNGFHERGDESFLEGRLAHISRPPHGGVYHTLDHDRLAEPERVTVSRPSPFEIAGIAGKHPEKFSRNRFPADNTRDVTSWVACITAPETSGNGFL